MQSIDSNCYRRSEKQKKNKTRSVIACDGKGEDIRHSHRISYTSRYLIGAGESVHN